MIGPPVPCVSAYMRDGTIYILPTRLCDRGYTDIEPAMVREASDPQAIGKFALVAAKLFKVGNPVMGWDDYKWPLFKAMKVRSIRAAERGTLRISIHFHSEKITIVPYEADPVGKGASELREKEIQVERQTEPESLGSAILVAFGHAR